MKVLFYIPTLRPGGAEKQCTLIASSLKKRYDYDCKVIVNWRSGAKPEFIKCLEDAGVELIALPQSLEQIKMRCFSTI